MKKYCIDDLVIEVGRRCNMCCSHCFRGEAEDLTIDMSYIDEVLDSFDTIYNLTITGGEPFLYPNEIKYIVDEIEKRNICVYQFFVSTNGTVKSVSVLESLIRLYALCEEKDLCCLQISNDRYHGESSLIKWDVFDAFAFTTFSGDIDEQWLISEGRAAEFYDSTRTVYDYGLTNDCDNHLKGLLYLSANGNILTACDYSYENQNKHAVGNIKSNSFSEIIESLVSAKMSVNY